MAPEQQEGGAVDHRADVYSLGVVCYELLTGEMPLGRFAPPSAKGAVDRRVDAVVLKALAREPSRRYQSADEMKRHLIAATRRRRLPWAIIALAAVVLLAAALQIPRMFAPAPAEALFRWGGDAEGGAPYIIESDNHKQPTGFEAELAEYLGAKLNLRPRFVQRSWDQLPEDLRRGTDIDVILNGYEWTPEREQMMASTIPYYVGKIVLVVRKDSPITGWEDLHRDRSGKTLTVGVLSESASHRYLREHYRTEEGSSDRELEIQDKSGDAITGFLDKVAKKDGMDATVLDVPAARYYVEQEKGNVRGAGDLKILWPAIEPTYNVVYCRTGDRALRERINDALREALRDGTLKRIYEKWGLWDDDQKELLVLSEHWPPQIEASSRTMLDHAWLLLRAAGVTVELACISMPLAMALGLLVAVGRLYGPRLLGWPLAVYVEVLRGTPLLMQLLAIYYLLPYAGLHFSGFWAAVLALAVNYSAYEAENYRAGLLAVSGGQMEAALALGMSRFQALRYVIVPQAVRLVVPPVTNDFIALFKDTSICSVIMVYELAKQYQSLVANFPQRGLELGLATAALYLAMSWPLSLLARRLEARSSRN
jgi:polar amino acid transport system substrate-binding protein